MRAVDLKVAVFMCGTGLGALLSSPATAVVELTYQTGLLAAWFATARGALVCTEYCPE